jgi:hypothetical protein
MAINIKIKPIWLWITIILLGVALFYTYYNSISLDEYTDCVVEYGDCVINNANLSIDYIELLNCYQRDMPTCDVLAQKEGYSPAVFKQYDCSSCSPGWCVVEGTSLCCPEPNMRIVNGECSH